MKISILSSSGQHITIPFPTSLLTNPVAVGGFLKHVQKYATVEMPPLSHQQVHALSKQLSQIRKRYQNLELLHVESASGTLVSITL